MNVVVNSLSLPIVISSFLPGLVDVEVSPLDTVTSVVGLSDPILIDLYSMILYVSPAGRIYLIKS